jgi:hypothetical protein
MTSATPAAPPNARPAGPGLLRRRLVELLPGVVAGAAAALVICGAVSPWFSISLLGMSAAIDGTTAHLHGRYALDLGAVALGLAVLVLVPSLHGRARGSVLVALGLAGICGLVLMWDQWRRLTTTAGSVGRATGLSPLGKYFGAHAGPSWGFWLDVAGFAVMVLASAAAAAIQPTAPATRRQSRRNAPPSTGMTQPVRYDAAGDNTNAAT